LWRRAGPGRGISRSRAMAFALGWLTLAGAVLSPLHALGERLFSAHMLEHEILMAVAAPLLALSRPLVGMLWALPRRWRGAVGGLARVGPLARLWRFATAPVI